MSSYRYSRFFLTLVITFILFGFYLIAFFLLPYPETFVTIKAQTETLKLLVSNPAQASFHIGKTKGIDLTNGQDLGCLEGIIIPKKETKINYDHIPKIGLTINLEGKNVSAFLLEKNENKKQLPQNIALTPDLSCAGNPIKRLPLWGVLIQMGQELSPPTHFDTHQPVLKSGNVTIYGRSLLSWYGLYKAGEFDIPTGAVVKKASGTANQLNELWGFAEYSPEVGLDVNASTDAPRLNILPLGSKIQPETIEIQALTRVISDPLLLQVQLFIAVFFSLITALSSLMALKRYQ